MSDSYLPEDTPPVFRGGDSLTVRSHEVRIDRRTGEVKPTHGISVDAVAADAAHFGGAYRVVSIPVELTIIQRGRRSTHFEIVPKQAMPLEAYQALLDQVLLELMEN